MWKLSIVHCQLKNEKGLRTETAQSPYYSLYIDCQLLIVPHAADGKTVVLIVVVPVHVGIVAVQVAIPRVVVIVLGSTPEVGVVAEIVGIAVEAVAGGNSRESKLCTVAQDTFTFPVTFFTTKAA